MENCDESTNEAALNGWSKDDKLRLLLALKVHTSKNIKLINEEIPKKSYEQICSAVKYYKRKAIRLRASNMFNKDKSKITFNPRIPLASWAKFLTDSLDYKGLQTETATAIRLLSEMEKLPPPACTDNVDLRKIYLQIANAMEGKPVSDDVISNCILRKCILETALISKAFIRNTAYKIIVDSIKISEEELNAFPKATKDNELSTIRHLASQRNYNPLNISEDYLKPSLTRTKKTLLSDTMS